MGLSKSERIYRINDYKKYLSIIYDYNKLKINIFAKKISNLKPKSIKDEKYSPSDFYKELDIFENMINEILIINYDLSNYFYNN
jgi:hypothetical protein